MNYPKHKHPHGINCVENKYRIWICTECDCIFKDEEIRMNICPGGHNCKAKKYKNKHSCEAHLEPYLPELGDKI